MKKLWSGMLALVLCFGISFGLVACAEDEIELDDDQKIVTITHKDVEYEVLTNPKRVITFDAGILDILHHVGLNTLGIERLGLPNASNFPTYLSEYDQPAKYPVVGTLKEVDTNAVLAFGADLVIVTGRVVSLYDSLEDLEKAVGTRVIDLSFNQDDGLQDILDTINVLGKIFTKSGVSQKITEIKNNLSDAMEQTQAITAANSELNGLIAMYVSGTGFSLFGNSGRYAMVHTDAGVSMAAPDISSGTHGQGVNYTYIAGLNPDIIYLVDRTAALGEEGVGMELLTNYASVQETNAHKSNRIINCDSQVWYLVYGGYRSTVMMLNDICRGYGETLDLTFYGFAS